MLRQTKQRLTLGGVVLGALFGVAPMIWLMISGLKAEIREQKKENASLSADIALCESEKVSLNRAIADQNAAIQRTKEQSERMAAQGEAARAEARKAREAADQAIARMRREDAIHQSCEEARLLMIREATQ